MLRSGEPLDEILWRGAQWAVTTYGIEALDGTYPIEKRRFAEGWPDWSWIRQVGEKTWVDIADFTTAFTVAIALHGQAADFDAALLAEHAIRATALASPQPPGPDDGIARLFPPEDPIVQLCDLVCDELEYFEKAITDLFRSKTTPRDIAEGMSDIYFDAQRRGWETSYITALEHLIRTGTIVCCMPGPASTRN